MIWDRLIRINKLPFYKGGSMGSGYILQLYLVKKAQIYNDSRATEVRENMSTGLLFFDEGFNQFLLNVISHGFLVTNKFYSGWNIIGIFFLPDLWRKQWRHRTWPPRQRLRGGRRWRVSCKRRPSCRRWCWRRRTCRRSDSSKRRTRQKARQWPSVENVKETVDAPAKYTCTTHFKIV